MITSFLLLEDLCTELLRNSSLSAGISNVRVLPFPHPFPTVAFGQSPYSALCPPMTLSKSPDMALILYSVFVFSSHEARTLPSRGFVCSLFHLPSSKEAVCGPALLWLTKYSSNKGMKGSLRSWSVANRQVMSDYRETIGVYCFLRCHPQLLSLASCGAGKWNSNCRTYSDRSTTGLCLQHSVFSL